LTDEHAAPTLPNERESASKMIHEEKALTCSHSGSR
jgi:hypothetical protein